MNPELLRYIQAHRATYTREAIRRRLLDAGYPAAEVDAALAAVEAGERPAPPPPGDPAAAPSGDTAPAEPGAHPSVRVANSPVFWLVLVGYTVGLYLLVWAIAVAASGVDDAGVIAALSFLGLWLAGLVGGLLLVRRNRPVGMALLLGFALAVGLPVLLAFVSIVIIAGICLVMGIPG
jgi:hypothetical protein